MRIRKFAKLAAAVGGCGGGSGPPPVVQQEAKVETNVCELNRSPWDVMTFPPQSHVKEAEDEEDEERDDMSTVQVGRVGSSRKMKSREAKEAKMESRERERVLCRKSGSKGWKCGKEAKQGHSLCDHHLELNRCYRYESCRKPVPAAAVGELRRSRCRRPSFHASVSDFYYYSGFGPRWRRRRRGSDSDDAPAVVVDDDDEDDDDVDEERGDAHELQQQELAGGTDVDNAGHDHYEDDDDDDDDADCGNRARKPRKARSLKSLCSEIQTS